MKTPKKQKLYRAQFSIAVPNQGLVSFKPLSLILFFVALSEKHVEDYLKTEFLKEIQDKNSAQNAFIKTLNIKQQRMDGIMQLDKIN